MNKNMRHRNGSNLLYNIPLSFQQALVLSIKNDHKDNKYLHE